MLSERGVTVVVFEQNPRPYGKIEDGLPRWHVKLRRKEYETIDERLDRPNVHFVPLTKIGRDLDFADLAHHWGFTSVILASGAWRDRPLPIEGAEDYVGRGLVYQNPFIYWFNHFTERGYEGPHYEPADGTVVVGGGLASIDVVKVLQIETVRRALANRGIEEEMLCLEHRGIPAVLAQHGLSWEDLGLRGAVLYYRRRIEDMPLIETPPDAGPERAKRFEATRRKILEKAMQKYRFQVRPLRRPAALLVEEDRLAGLRFRPTRVVDGTVADANGALEEIRAPLVISSIGSIPEPIAGIGQRGDLYDYTDRELGRVRGYDNVFSTGNVVTGKGNIVVSRKHSVEITTHVIEQFLGLGPDHAGEEKLLDQISADAKDAAEKVGSWVEGRPKLEPERIEAILKRVRERQNAVGYTGSYRDWLAEVTPRR
jgi:ferredoxin--NADP+ reductase